MRVKNKKDNLKIKYLKKQALLLSVILLITISMVFIFARYVTNSVNDFFVRSKEFYFYSDKLTEEGSVFQIENWSGVEDYTIIVNMNSRKNNIEAASYDIAYDISYTCSDNAICQLSKQSGIISSNGNTDSFNLTITPNAQLDSGDKVVVEIKAKANTSYEKTIKGKFTLVVGQEKLTYQITDQVNNPYMELRMTNTLSYYIVDQAFGEFAANQKIDIDTYLGLSDADKAKCHSSIVTITFDPNVILLDLTSERYQQAVSTQTQTINGKNYINSITLQIDAISSADLRFYKVDTSQNYTYPNSSNTSVVSITSR